MSQQTPSPDSPFDPDDQQAKYDEAFDDLLNQLGDIGMNIGDVFNQSVDPEKVTLEDIEDVYEDNADDVEKWNEILDIANEPDPGPSQADMIWEAEKRKSQYPRGRGFRMKMTDADEWLNKRKNVSE